MKYLVIGAGGTGGCIGVFMTEAGKDVTLIARDDMAEVNLQILDSLSPESSTSMQRDVYAGKSSEIDGLIYEVVRMGREYHVPVPAYEMIAEKMREQGLV